GRLRAMNPHERVLRETASATKAGDWALVLTAAGIPHRVDEGGGRFAVVVPAEDEPRAAEALAGYDEEGAPHVPPPAPDPRPRPLTAGRARSACWRRSGSRGCSW